MCLQEGVPLHEQVRDIPFPLQRGAGLGVWKRNLQESELHRNISVKYFLETEEASVGFTWKIESFVGYLGRE